MCYYIMCRYYKVEGLQYLSILFLSDGRMKMMMMNKLKTLS